MVAEVLALEELPADLQAVAWLAKAEIAVRGLAATEARTALTRARGALDGARNELLARAMVGLEAELSNPMARLERAGVVRPADLYAIEAASTGEVMLVDACRRLAVAGRASIPLARRPILFALLLVLARAWLRDVARDELAARAFDARRVNASHRSRLRVEVGRLRKVMAGLAEPVATEDGYCLESPREVVTLLPPTDDDDARIAILLGDGAAWSAQSLAEHAVVSERTVQRALAVLIEDGSAVRTGTAKDVRYVRPGPRVASRMLLFGLVPATWITVHGGDDMSQAEIVREYGPFGEEGVHGVTYDGKLVWFARLTIEGAKTRRRRRIGRKRRLLVRRGGREVASRSQEGVLSPTSLAGARGAA